jgi:hypothetical protein
MPTHNRRRFVPLAIGYFQRQDYPHKELIIVDDGTDPVDDLVPRQDQRVRYIRLPGRMSVGAKRNLACEHARGPVIAHWDDDDWHAPHRLTYQVRGLLESGADVCGISTLLFYDPDHDQAWQYTYPDGERPWLAGSSLCYTRAFWTTNRFADIDISEDARFVWAGRPERMLVLPDHTFHVGMIHPQNVSSKRTDEPYWRACPVSQIQALLGSDWRAYQAPPPTPLAGPPRAHERDIPPMTTVRTCRGCVAGSCRLRSSRHTCPTPAPSWTAPSIHARSRSASAGCTRTCCTATSARSRPVSSSCPWSRTRHSTARCASTPSNTCSAPSARR